jgi:hypothetical protein
MEAVDAAKRKAKRRAARRRLTLICSPQTMNHNLAAVNLAKADR